MIDPKILYITTLRDEKTSIQSFRHAADKLSHLLAYETLARLKTKELPIKTPNAPTIGTVLDQEIVLVPILRSGMAMLPIFLQYLPQATVGVVGLKRDEITAQAHWYYCNLPQLHENQCIIILDPMIATGGTGIELLTRLTDNGIIQQQIIYVSMLCAPEGLDAIRYKFPYITFVLGVTDSQLNSSKFIVPGLGDFGDRYFGT
ncbi:MAG: uracil phosphoribosyltransferase [Candidatus Dependentiae bacterium]